ncbi:hypothetical protein [Mesobacterium pallidum]|nr:hypothetical protein [Mesobacterium pallidum]
MQRWILMVISLGCLVLMGLASLTAAPVLSPGADAPAPPGALK